MEKKGDNSLARFERRKTNYPLVITAVVMFGILIAGAVVSVRAEFWVGTGLFGGGIVVFALVALLDMAQTRRLAAVDDRKFIQWDAAMPEIQRQNVNVEVHELARLLKVGDEALGDLLSAYIVAEDLALRQIQLEENRPLIGCAADVDDTVLRVLIDLEIIELVGAQAGRAGGSWSAP